MNALELINRALYLAGVASKDYEEISDTQLNDGIFWLNAVLSEKKIRSASIPFRLSSGDTYELAEGVETYTIPDLVSIDSLTFTNDNNLRYSIRQVTFQQYWATSRTNNTSGLPSIYYPDRQDFGMKISVYPFPQQIYTLNIRGKWGIAPITKATLTNTLNYEDFFLGLVTMETSKKLTMQYDETWSPEKDAELNRVRNQVYGMIGVDMSKNSRPQFSTTNANVQTMLRGWNP